MLDYRCVGIGVDGDGFAIGHPVVARAAAADEVESARAFDEGGGGRLAEFVRRVRTERVENPRAAQVRVMTVHGAKGLEFDRVILADLDRGLSAGGRDKVKVWSGFGGAVFPVGWAD